MKNKYKLKGWVVVCIYFISIGTIVSSLFLVGKVLKRMSFNNDNLSYVYRDLVSEVVPVMGSDVNKFIRPFSDDGVSVVKEFYDMNSDVSVQENALFFYQNTYIPSTGILYGSVADFEVLSVLDGTVESVYSDDLLGTVVNIRHTNNLVSSYQSLSSCGVVVGQTINQGDVIGMSGVNKVDSSMNSYLFFEVNFNGVVINPSSVYDKLISSLE